MQISSNYNLPQILKHKDLAHEICFFLSLKTALSLFATSKELKIIDITWYESLRNRTIKCLSGNKLDDKQTTLISDYTKNFYPLTFRTSFLYKWFQNKEDKTVINDLFSLINESSSSPSSSMNVLPGENEILIQKLLEKKDIEAAFVFAALEFEKTSKYKLNNKIQEHISKKSFNSALTCTLKLTNNTEIKDIAINGFLHYGIKKISLENDFIKCLSDFPERLSLSGSSLLLKEYIVPLIEKDSDDREFANLIKTLFKLIHEDYKFDVDYISYEESNFNSSVLEYFISCLEDSDTILDCNPESITKDKVSQFIKAVEEIPHVGLIKQIVTQILDGLYQEDLDIHLFRPALHDVENHFKLQPRAMEWC